ncbi:hypothetical protein CYMTET_53462 [Cymbomonas tetramitiformis]|uniref:MYND-type domain-containing protein n=1 Tax=Cymbomonas tetramitiformis TaxID=36881 RepID=A0AAE0ERQ0_9CHLO|nr:hypothetical protein CYMTET_53462 [Cymbomonas tetramitiformis]
MGGTWRSTARTLTDFPAHSRETGVTATANPDAQTGEGVKAPVVTTLKHEDDVIRRQHGLPGMFFHSELEGVCEMNAPHEVAVGDNVEACATCGKTNGESPSTTLFRCSRCKVVYYCGIECQQLHWRKHVLICTAS